MLCNRLRLRPVMVVCLALVLWSCGGKDSPTSGEDLPDSPTSGEDLSACGEDWPTSRDADSPTSGGQGASPRDEQRFSLSNGVEMEFVWIEPGLFQMGSPCPEPGRDSDEGPVHEVEISKGFWLGTYEITQRQWAVVMGTTPWSRWIVGEGSSHPAVGISWYNVQEFIDRLNAAAGEALYRLPTEAEWEYACRAGTQTRWSFGDNESQLRHYAWYRDNATDVREGYGHAVGTKSPNLWGLYDMHGNVHEWVQDWYDFDYYNRSPLVDPLGPSSGYFRVIRGGYFNYHALGVRSAYRTGRSPDESSPYIGGRLLRVR